MGSRRTPAWAVWVVVLCTLLMTGAQLLLKLGLTGMDVPLMLSGVALMVVGGFLLTIALKHGELSVLHPVLSLSFAWVLLVSAWLNEPLGWHQYVGVTGIIVGVSLIGSTRRAG